MQIGNTNTPVYVKTGDFVWPDQERMFYLLARDGLFLCRNHIWFKSCAPAKTGPSELAEQKSFCQVDYPKIPRALIEKAVGFFYKIHQDKDGAESALILVWNLIAKQVEFICPEQKVSWGSVKYDIPNLPPHLILLGDLHSHGTMDPNPSMMDEGDELHRPGLHFIVGDINHEPPNICCMAVVDGSRFRINNPFEMFEGYNQRDSDVPPEWVEKVKKHEYTTTYAWDGKPDENDKEIIKHLLDGFLDYNECPRVEQVTSDLFRGTKRANHQYCEKRAEDFINGWKKAKAHHEKTQTTLA